jgi:diacylglycerol kinase (ATP)
VKAFAYAFSGIAYVWRAQKNFRIQVVLGIVALAVCAALRVSATGFAILALAIAVVLALEALNSGLEALVDLASPQIHPLAKAAKDAAAGAVLLAAAGSVAVGAFLAWQALSPR